MSGSDVRVRGIIGAAWAISALACAAGTAVPAPVAARPPVTSESVDAFRLFEAREPSPAIRAIVDAPDRKPEDRLLDGGRHPAELLSFLGVRPGLRVAELGAGGGYTTELLARAVLPGGAVYAQNSPFILQRFAAQPWADRMARPAMKGVVRLDREFDDPFPPDVKDMDLVVCVLIYHDTVWMKADRDRMNRAVFAALRPGGIYAIVDHSARAGTGLADVQTFHRIEEPVLIAEVLRAGFRPGTRAEFLRHPEDARDWNDSGRAAGERRGTSDRFALTFVRP